MTDSTEAEPAVTTENETARTDEISPRDRSDSDRIADGESADIDPAVGEDGPVWTEEDDDRTAETLRWLRVKQRARRRRRSRDLAVVLYTVFLAAVGYGSGFTYHFLRQLQIEADYSGAGAGIQRVLPAGCALLTAAVALLAARDALWRGPVVVPGPSVGWLLAQPVRRAAVLRPWLWLSVALAVLSASLVASGAAVVLHVTSLAPICPALLAVLPAAICLPLLTIALATAVERRPRLAGLVRRWTPGVVVLLLLLAGQTVFAARGHRVTALEWCELWSGPWGWAVQPVVHATGGSAPGWPVAAGLLVLAAAAALLGAHRDAAGIPHAQLRRRAATLSSMTSAMWTVELRAAKLAMAEATGGARVRRVRLRPPRSRRLTIVWRDALTLLRSPGRLGAALVRTVGASAAAGAGAQEGGELRIPLLIGALLLGYFAVGALAEPARLETDDPRRSAWSPSRLRILMLQHAIVPAVVGALLAALAAVPYAVAGSPWTMLLMPLCAIPFAAAAVYGACRGPVRVNLLFTGVTTPIGDPGPLLFVAWYASGPLVTLGVLAFVLDGALVHGPSAHATGQALLAVVGLTAGLLAFAVRSADRLVRTSR